MLSAVDIGQTVNGVQTRERLVLIGKGKWRRASNIYLNLLLRTHAGLLGGKEAIKKVFR